MGEDNNQTRKERREALDRQIFVTRIVVDKFRKTLPESLDQLFLDPTGSLIHDSLTLKNRLIIDNSLIMELPIKGDVIKEYWMIAAQYGNLSENLMKKLVDTGDTTLMCTIIQNESCEDNILEYIAKTVATEVDDDDHFSTNHFYPRGNRRKRSGICEALLIRETTRVTVRERLLRFHWLYKKWMLKNSKLDPEIASQFENDLHMEDKLTHGDCSIEILVDSADYPDPFIRMMVADNCETPPSILSKLAEDLCPLVKFSVVKNQNTLTSSLQYLITERSVDILSSIAKHRNSDVDILIKLSSKNNRRVLYNILNNSNTPPHLIATLALKKDLYIKQAAISHPRLPILCLPEIIKGTNFGMKQLIARRKDLSKESVNLLVNDDNAFIREYIAANESVDFHLVRELANDQHNLVKAAMGSRNDLPSDLQFKLANDINHYVAGKTISHITDLKLLAKLRIVGQDELQGIIRSRIYELRDQAEAKHLALNKDELASSKII